MTAKAATVGAHVSWDERRTRAEELHERHPFARELLGLYLALLPVQAQACDAVRESPPPAAELPRWAAERAVPGVIEATEAAGPPALREAVRDRVARGGVGDVLAGWLADAELAPVDRYLARASLAPTLEALGERAREACDGGAGETAAICPCCGGPPQVSQIESPDQSLKSGSRSLLCARCGSSWSFSRSRCPACGESDEGKLVQYAENWAGPVVSHNAGSNGADPAMFPHLRIVGCSTCQRYLMEVDMGRDGRAVPEVDELAALPLDLYAAEQGLSKVTPNLMGF